MEEEPSSALLQGTEKKHTESSETIAHYIVDERLRRPSSIEREQQAHRAFLRSSVLR